jgi:hypothetical protein
MQRSGTLSPDCSAQELYSRLQEVMESNQTALASIKLSVPPSISPALQTGLTGFERTGRDSAPTFRSILSSMSTPSPLLRASYQYDSHSKIPPVMASTSTAAASKHHLAAEHGSASSSSAEPAWPFHRSHSVQSAMHGRPGSSSATKTHAASGNAAATASSRVSAAWSNAAAATSAEPNSDASRRKESSNDWARELARRVPQTAGTSAALGRTALGSKPVPALHSLTSADLAAAAAARAPLDAYLQPHSETPVLQRTALDGSAPAGNAQDVADGVIGSPVYLETMQALKSQLLYCEGNMRMMQSAVDELHRRNSDLEVATLSTKNEKNAQLVDVLKQLATVTDQLREAQQHREDSLNTAQAAEQSVSELRKSLDDEVSARDAQQQALEKACAASALAAETATSKLKVAADECKRLEREIESVQLDNDRIKKMMRAQISRADEATAMWREAEADIRQCKQAMQLDAARLQVWCVSSDLCVYAVSL